MLTSNQEGYTDRPDATAEISPQRVELVLFDLDGTLVDSVGDLAWCGNEMLRRLDMPAHDPSAARSRRCMNAARPFSPRCTRTMPATTANCIPGFSRPCSASLASN